MNLETKNNELQESLDRFKIIEDILASEPSVSKAMSDFSTIAMKEFTDFANSEFSVKEDAGALLIMQDIERKLKEISIFKSIFNKNIVGIGGRFSAGKSSFINSFLSDKKLVLAQGISPTTAIPTYIASSQKEKNIIKLHTYKNAKLELCNKKFLSLNRSFFEKFNFNFKDIAPYITIEAKLDKLEHICFIDTPGYNNPSKTSSLTDDKASSKEYLNHGDILIWVIAIENGAILGSDIDFLGELNIEDKKVFIVVNRADSIPLDNVKEIVNNFVKVLDDNFIEYEGISAYNLIDKEELYFKKTSLKKFLENIDKPLDTKKDILLKIDKVFKFYDDAIKTDIDWVKKMIRASKTLSLNLLENNSKKKEMILSEVIKNNQSSIKNPMILKEMRVYLKDKFDVEKLEEIRKKGKELNEKIKNLANEVLKFGD